MLNAFFAVMGKINPITVSLAWGLSFGPSPVSSASRTMTVPGGNPGVMKWSVADFFGTSFQYSKNGGAFATVTHNATITVATGDTIQFKLTGAGATCHVDVIDNTLGTTIGSWECAND